MKKNKQNFDKEKHEKKKNGTNKTKTDRKKIDTDSTERSALFEVQTQTETWIQTLLQWTQEQQVPFNHSVS